MSVDAQRGHDGCDGNVTIAQRAHRLPISRGSPPDDVKIPSATGTRAIATSCGREPLEKGILFVGEQECNQSPAGPAHEGVPDGMDGGR
jgi:hypothetical protein